MAGAHDQLEIGLFGALRVEVGSHDLTVSGDRQQRLLARLALSKGSPVSRAALADAVWGAGDPPADPDTGIRTYAGRLRRDLDAHASIVETVEGGYRLTAAVSTDLERFDTHVRRGRTLAETGETERAINELGAALDLSAEPLLGGWAEEAWVLAEGRRNVETRLAAAGLRAELQTSLGYHDAAVELLAPLHADHPHHEGVAKRLAAALYAQGRAGDALDVIAEFRRRLATDLGLDPTPDLVDLEASILDHRPAAQALRQPLRSYELGERIGEGSFSIVYRGRQPSVDREVAIKVIRAELANDADFVRRFEAEAQMVARLEHPHIVPLYDFWREPDAAYLVMRWLRGGTLQHRLTHRTLSIDEIMTLVDQVGDALALAHARGVVHRDVKPANVFLDESDRFYLGDFGIAVDSHYGPDPAAALSLGSPAYASPEQLQRAPVSPATDVYGLAITVYEALSGRLPFADAASHAELVRRQLDEELPRLSNVMPGLPNGLDDVIAAATAKDPEQRTPDIATFTSDLRTAIDPGHPAPAPTVGSITLIGDGVCPYVGLAAFDESDADRFYGRDRLATQVIERLRHHHMVTVVGPSGSGKSSLVRSGVVPRLRQGALSGSDEWFVVTMTPGADPYEALEAALLRVAVNPPPSLREQLLADDRGIARSVRRVLPDDDAQLLVVFDQMEELFTLCEDEELRRGFLRALINAVEDGRVRVLATIRADHYDRPLRHPELGQAMRDGTIPVTPLAPDELERVIVDPAARVGVEFEPGLVPTIVADVNDQPGALPLLQFTLTRLWDRQVSGVLTMDAYRELGGVSGSLAAEADALYERLEPPAQLAARAVFQRLVVPGEGRGDTRRRSLRTELEAIDGASPVVETYGAARLLSFDRDNDTRQPTIEVAHEALLREWPRLAAWIDEDRDGLRAHRHLTAAATAWRDRGRDPAELYRGGRLEAALELAGTAALTDDEQAFLDAGVAAADALARNERRRVARLRTLAGVAGVVAVIAVIAGLVAFREQQRADDNAASAEEASALAGAEAVRANESAEEARVQADLARAALADAEIATLISRSAALVEENPTASLLLAVEAHDRERSNRTAGALATALNARVGETLRLDLEPIDHVHCEEGAPAHDSYLPLSRDGWVGWHRDGGVHVIDPATGRSRLHATMPDPCAGVSWSFLDGPLVYEIDGEVSIERAPGSGDRSPLMSMSAGSVFFGAVTGAGADAPAAVLVRDAARQFAFHLFGPDGQGVATPLDVGFEAGLLQLSGSGAYGMAADVSVNEFEGQTAGVFDATTGDLLWEVETAAQISWIDFAPDDALVAIADLSGRVTVLEVETGTTVHAIDLGAGAAASVAFMNPRRIAVATGPGVEVWDLDGPVQDHEIPLNGAAAVRTIDDHRLTVVTDGQDEMVVLDLEQSGLAERVAELAPGSRAFVSSDGHAALADIAAARGEVIDLVSGERAVHPLAVPGAGLVVGISPAGAVDRFNAFTIDGAVGLIENGEAVQVLALSDDPQVSIRQARGHRTPDGYGSVAVMLSDPTDPDSVEVFLVGLNASLTEVLSVVGPDCACGGVLPSPDGTALVVDDGRRLTIHGAGGDARSIEASPTDPFTQTNHGVHHDTNRILRGTSSGLVELVDLEAGTIEYVDDFGSAIGNVSFIDADTAAVVTTSGEVWMIDLASRERVALVWHGGSADITAGSPVVSVDGAVLWIPTATELVAVPLSVDVWRAEACRLAGRNLTPDEWTNLVPGDREPQLLCAEWT